MSSSRSGGIVGLPRRLMLPLFALVVMAVHHVALPIASPSHRLREPSLAPALPPVQEVIVQKVGAKKKKFTKTMEVALACKEVDCVKDCTDRASDKCGESEHCNKEKAKLCKKACAKARCDERCTGEVDASYVARELKLEKCTEKCEDDPNEDRHAKCKAKCEDDAKSCKVRCRCVCF